MATLERRVQILLDPVQYEQLEAESAATHRSIASLIREAIEERSDGYRAQRRAAVERLLSSADAPGSAPMKDWAEYKAELELDLYGEPLE